MTSRRRDGRRPSPAHRNHDGGIHDRRGCPRTASRATAGAPPARGARAGSPRETSARSNSLARARSVRRDRVHSTSKPARVSGKYLARRINNNPARGCGRSMATRALVRLRRLARVRPLRAVRVVVRVGVAPPRPTPARRRRPPSTRPFVSIWTSRTTSADGWTRATSSACSCWARPGLVSPP